MSYKSENFCMKMRSAKLQPSSLHYSSFFEERGSKAGRKILILIGHHSWFWFHQKLFLAFTWDNWYKNVCRWKMCCQVDFDGPFLHCCYLFIPIPWIGQQSRTLFLLTKVYLLCGTFWNLLPFKSGKNHLKFFAYYYHLFLPSMLSFSHFYCFAKKIKFYCWLM